MRPFKDVHRPSKRFGQNFLINPAVRAKIVKTCRLKSSDTVLEIGAGQGALTQEIARHAKHVVAVEKDSRLIPSLMDIFKDSNVEIIHADILKYPIEKLPKNPVIIGNIPYSISTPIIEKLIASRRHFTDAYLTVQWEFGKRLVADPNNKDYGSLSCYVQYYWKAKKMFNIKNTAFNPPPKVQSCFIHLARKTKKKRAKDERFLFRIIQTAFQQRRKVVTNALGRIIDREQLGKIFLDLGLNKKSRPENLSLEDYINIANAVYADRP